MRRTLLFTAIVLSAAAPAYAQVTVDLHALDALPSRPAPPPAPARAPRMEAAARPSAPAALPRPPVPAPATPAPTAPAPAPPAATLPTAPPPVATIAPVAPPPPPANPATPPAPPIVANASTTAAKEPAGLQLSFAPKAADLSPDSAAAIKQFVQSTPIGSNTTFNVRAYAAGVAGDPSEPRRVSLNRAIAVREAMIADGVPAANIYMLALGAQGSGGPPDRVDIQVMGANVPTGAKSP